MAEEPSSDVPESEVRLRRQLGTLIVLGVVLVIGGVVGLAYVAVATITSVLLFGWLLLVSGIVGLLHALQDRGSNYFWLGLVVAALYLAAGVVVIRHPGASAEGLTLFAALLFLAGGVFRLVGAIVVRGQQMIWTLVQGAFGLLLGVLVLSDWPENTLYVLGTFFSLALLFEGLGLIATGVGGRHLVSLVAQGRTPEPPEGKTASEQGEAEPIPPGDAESMNGESDEQGRSKD